MSTTSGNLRYASAPTYTGADSFGFVASDGHGAAVSSTLHVNVVVPTPPTCTTPAAVSVRPTRSKFFFLNCNDHFGADLTYEITDQPEPGARSPARTSFRTYTAGNTAGDDAFSYRATSENGTSTAVTQVIHVTPSANSAPQCFSNSGFPEKTPTGTAHQLNPSCSDEDGDTVSYTKLSEPVHGTLSDSGGTLATPRPTATPAPTSSTTRRPTATVASPRRRRASSTSSRRRRRAARRPRR